MTKKLLFTAIVASAMTLGANAEGNTIKVDGRTGATSQVSNDTTAKRVNKFLNAISRLHIGGYGEAVMSRNFYSQHFNRYKFPEQYCDGSHGRFDLPHVTINIGYDFGKGWTMGSEIEYEHGGTESAVEVDPDESGEYEAETERGGEVCLEQFWINKEFWKGKFNAKAGEIIIPVGEINQNHMPMDFFSVYRSEGEATILPNTWHQVGISLWGRLKDWRYEAIFTSGLDAERFGVRDFAHYGATSPYEYKIANVYAGAARVDNFSIKGLRLSVSGYYGYTLANTEYKTAPSSSAHGGLAIGSFGFELNRWNWIVRGNATYAHLDNADEMTSYLNHFPKHSVQDGTPSKHSPIAEAAYSVGIEAGYNVFSQIGSLRDKQKLYVFGRYEDYNSYAKGTQKEGYAYTHVKRLSFGINYIPIKQVVIKGEWSNRILDKQYNNEPSLSLGIAYQGWFF